jgi:hypothetical protein
MLEAEVIVKPKLIVEDGKSGMLTFLRPTIS